MLRGSDLYCWWVVGISVVVLFGCSGGHESTVSGTVYFDDKPLHTGNVTYYPTSGGAAVYSQIAEDGTYRLTTGSTQGLQPGEYRVTVIATENPPPAAPGQAPPIGTRITPVKYSLLDQTDLVFNVTAGANTIDLHLSSQ